MIRRQVVVPAPPADVWEFLTNPDAPDSWLGGHLEWTAEEGGELRFAGEDGEVRRGVVEVVRPPSYIRYRWWPEGAGDGPESQEGTGVASRVSFLLEPEEEDTRLTVSEQIVTAPEAPASSGPGVSASSGAEMSDCSVPETFGSSVPGTIAGSTTWGAGDDRRFRAWAASRAPVVCR